MGPGKTRCSYRTRIRPRGRGNEGAGGPVTARDPDLPDHFWVNPLAMNSKQIRVKDLMLVNSRGEVVEGNWPVDAAALVIPSQIHAARLDVVSAAHAHSVYCKAWSSLRRPLDPLTQDTCAFYGAHALLNDYTGVVLDLEEGQHFAHALGGCTAAILANHGWLTPGHTVDEAAWWFIAMERSCQTQLPGEGAGTPVLIDRNKAEEAARQVGEHSSGWLSSQPSMTGSSRNSPTYLRHGSAVLRCAAPR